ncbi:MAG: glycine--tRNA ligase subunit beta [Thermoleophilia bacterium]|nr:glycine--tRNA ligase subunit beta [Thermoleophilia bacterium]
MTAPLLIELGCEELPANACRVAEREAGLTIERLLTERRLAPTSVEVFVTPRRIAVIAEGVASEAPAETSVQTGPPEKAARNDDGSWSKAAEGFARKHGLTPDELEVRDGLLTATVSVAAEPLATHAQALVDGLIEGLQMPKNMRWGTGTQRFSRPIRTLVVLHGDTVLPAEVQGVQSGRLTCGHRLLQPVLELGTVDDYVSDLGGAGVGVRTADRREIIETLLTSLAMTHNSTWDDPGRVLNEVVYLVEWPRVIDGSIHERYLDLPERVLVTAMQSHQRYLPLRGSTGTLRPAFLTVVNSHPDADAMVRAGNERVLAGRLDDAVFSLAKDRVRGIEAMAAELDRITYHQRLGTLADRTARLEALVAAVADGAGIVGDDRTHALEAARLAKADLASTLVGEFAELQGETGMEYARAAGQPEAVAVAIREQYQPDGAGRPVPETLPGALLALADRFDQLVGVVAIGERPTGSRDPYALRRAAAGIVEIQSRYGLALDLPALVATTHALLVAQDADLELEVTATVEIVVPFILDRVDQALGDAGVPVDVQRAARGAGQVDPARHAALARALHAAADSAELAAAHAAVTRCSRIVEKETAADAVDPALLSDASEVALAEVVATLAPRIATALDPAAALQQAAALAPAVDALFDGVMVLAEDPAVRANRVRLLHDALAAFQPIGDLTQLQR